MSYILFFLLLTPITFSYFLTPILTLTFSLSYSYLNSYSLSFTPIFTLTLSFSLISSLLLSLILTHIFTLTLSHPYSYLYSYSLSFLLISSLLLSLILTHIFTLTFSHPYSYLHSTECCSHACQPMVWTYSRWLSCTTHCSSRRFPSCWRHPHHPHQYCWWPTRTLRTYTSSLHLRKSLFYFIFSLFFIRIQTIYKQSENHHLPPKWKVIESVH